MVQVLVDDALPQLFHGEIVHRNEVAVGYVRAASYGFTLGGAVGLAMVTSNEPVSRDWVNAGTWEVDIAGQRFPAKASIRPMYDPTASRIKA
jgi:4-methylaminobutanoate oxidase (formaldehyde-forming)